MGADTVDAKSSVDGSLRGGMIFIHKRRPCEEGTLIPCEEGVLENAEKGV